MRAGLAASTVTPGITAPDVSFTTPAMLPLSWVWPQVTSGKSTRHDAITTHAILRAFMAVVLLRSVSWLYAASYGAHRDQSTYLRGFRALATRAAPVCRRP